MLYLLKPVFIHLRMNNRSGLYLIAIFAACLLLVGLLYSITEYIRHSRPICCVIRDWFSRITTRQPSRNDTLAPSEYQSFVNLIPATDRIPRRSRASRIKRWFSNRFVRLSDRTIIESRESSSRGQRMRVRNRILSQVARRLIPRPRERRDVEQGRNRSWNYPRSQRTRRNSNQSSDGVDVDISNQSDIPSTGYEEGSAETARLFRRGSILENCFEIPYHQNSNVKRFFKHQKRCKSCACAICLEDFVIGERVVMLPCKHCYHRHCILECLKSHTRCPLCRLEIRRSRQSNERTSLL